jgi:hypothetical protein
VEGHAAHVDFRELPERWGYGRVYATFSSLNGILMTSHWVGVDQGAVCPNPVAISA